MRGAGIAESHVAQFEPPTLGHLSDRNGWRCHRTERVERFLDGLKELITAATKDEGVFLGKSRYNVPMEYTSVTFFQPCYPALTRSPLEHKASRQPLQMSKQLSTLASVLT